MDHVIRKKGTGLYDGVDRLYTNQEEMWHGINVVMGIERQRVARTKSFLSEHLIGIVEDNLHGQWYVRIHSVPSCELVYKNPLFDSNCFVKSHLSNTFSLSKPFMLSISFNTALRGTAVKDLVKSYFINFSRRPKNQRCKANLTTKKPSQLSGTLYRYPTNR